MLKRAVIIAIVALLAILAVSVFAMWANDVRKDRKHIVKVIAPTPMFAGSGDENCEHRNQMGTLPQGIELRVERVRYWKNCATLNVATSDGRKGFIVLGVGNVSVIPALNNWR